MVKERNPFSTVVRVSRLAGYGESFGWATAPAARRMYTYIYIYLSIYKYSKRLATSNIKQYEYIYIYKRRKINVGQLKLLISVVI